MEAFSAAARETNNGKFGSMLDKETVTIQEDAVKLTKDRGMTDQSLGTQLNRKGQTY